MMNKSIGFVVQTTIATVIGIIVLAVFMGIVVLTLDPIINLLFPPLPPCPPGPEGGSYSPGYPCYYSAGGMMNFGQNFAKSIDAFLFLYFLGICLAGFISGLYVSNLKLQDNDNCKNSYMWQSVISGSFVGAAVPLFLMFILSNRHSSVGDIFLAFCLGTPAIFSALIGYKIQVYKQGFTNNPQALLKKLVPSTFIGLIIFMVLRLIFNPIIGADYSIFKPTPGLFYDMHTESMIVFGIILLLACFISGWWSNVNGYFEYGAINGFIVGILAPFLGAYLDNSPTPALYLLFIGTLGGLYGLVGSVCYIKFQSWRFGFSKGS